MITKWNIVRRIYGNKDNVGSDLAVELKYVELWTENPEYYTDAIQNSQILGLHLKMFCENHRRMPNLDFKLLYTHGVGGGVMGVAYTNGVCLPNTNCGVCKVSTIDLNFSKFEMHEMGHNLGFLHFDSMGGEMKCGKVKGFMSGERSYSFAPCYREVLENTIRSRRCLTEDNVTGYYNTALNIGD